MLDGETGEPLPFATVTWDDGRRGVVADEGGAFVLSLRTDGAAAPPSLTASFVGYGPEEAAPRGDALTFRLRPEAGAYPAVVVNALTFSAPVDTAWAARLRPGLYDAVGEGGGLRALEVLPSVAPSAAFDEGLIVRGSPSDAFEVRLDGVPVYNPRHLFGLVDAFNGDALRAVALYVGVAPARVAVAPGGAVEYVTATGSPRGPSAEAGVSSLAARGSVSIPIRPGRTTVLVGGRTSLLRASPWIGDALVEEGLGVVRQTSSLPAATAEVLSRVVDVQATSASFWDLHVGGADERAGGGRTAVTFYAGGDDTSLEALRFFADRDDAPAARRPVATRNRWGSGAVSVSDQRPLTARLVLHSRVGGSAYDARFGQSDFTFNPDRLNPLAAFVDTLGYDNELREGIVAQRLDAVLGGGLASGGYSLHLYRQRYEETAAFRPTFVADQTATRLDLHAEWSGRVLPALDLAAGLRTHVYSAGGVRLEPPRPRPLRPRARARGLRRHRAERAVPPPAHARRCRRRCGVGALRRRRDRHRSRSRRSHSRCERGQRDGAAHGLRQEDARAVAPRRQPRLSATSPTAPSCNFRGSPTWTAGRVGSKRSSACPCGRGVSGRARPSPASTSSTPRSVMASRSPPIGTAASKPPFSPTVRSCPASGSRRRGPSPPARRTRSPTGSAKRNGSPRFRGSTSASRPAIDGAARRPR